MATAEVKLDMAFILNMIKNDRQFTVIAGVPRDAYAVKQSLDSGILTLVVESEGIGKEGIIDVEIYGNADAVDEDGKLLPIKPATIL